jgi:hypothetical protein
MLLKWAIAAREPCRVHLLNVTRLGRPFWNLLSLHPAVEEDGRADYYLGVQVSASGATGAWAARACER